MDSWKTIEWYYWNRLPEQVVSAGSVRAFISRLNSIHVSLLMYYVNLNIFTRS